MTVKLVGSSSGSMSIAAPATTTSGANRTITLNDTYGGDGTFVTANSSGNVGIGTASPPSTLSVEQSSSNVAADLHATGSGRGSQIKFHNDHAVAYVGQAGDTTGDFIVYNGSNSNMLFSTNGTERMRIESGGHLQLVRDKYIGTVASGQSTINIGTSGGAQIGFHKSGDNNDELKFYTHTSGVAHAERMSIDPSGDLRVGRVYSNTTSGGANVRVQSDGLMQRDTSSRRYKNSIADATHGLADLNKLRPVTYKGNNDGDTVFGGLIAEEVHDAGLTEFVDYDSDNQPDALKYGNMVSLCIKAIQELSAKVEILETKVAALEAK